MKIKSAVTFIAIMALVSLSGCSWFQKAEQAEQGSSDKGKLEIEIGGDTGASDATGDLEIEIGGDDNGTSKDTGEVEIQIGQ